MVEFPMPLIDSRNRRIDYLRVSVTDRCNLACAYCKPRSQMQALPHREILSYEEILRLARVAVPLGIVHIRVTGGEPLIRRGLVEFLGELGKISGIEDVSLTTNGVLLPDLAVPLRAAGIRRLNISLDSLDRMKFFRITNSDSWERVWQGIEAAEAAGFHPIKINMVPVIGVNDDEVVDFAKLTLRRKLHVRFIEFMPIGAGDRWHRDACMTTSSVREAIERALGRLEPAGSSAGAGPSDNYRIAGASGIIGFISPISKHFCDSCRRLRLTADGNIRPCLLSDREINIKSSLRSGCDDRQVERVLRQALAIKPDQHRIDALGSRDACFERTMSRIGG